MALSARFSLLHSDLNDFLFASVGDEQNGMPLSVISALTRLGLEPWEEAARLAALPKALAAEALAPMIARLSLAWGQRSDNLAIAQRVVGLLPMRGQVAEPGREQTGAWDKILPMRGQVAEPGREQTGAWDKRYSNAVTLLGCLALGAAVLFAML